MRDRNLRLAMELLLIRHALPIRIEGATGPADPPLAELGRRQADALAEWLADEPLDAIYTSPLRRALETAAPLASRHGLVAIVEDDLAEFDREADYYVPIEELKAEDDPRWHQMVAGEWTSDGTVDPAAFAAGVIAGIERIIAAHSGQTVAIVAHGGVVNVYLAHILGTTRPMFFEPAYTSISRVLAARSGQRQVRSVNETAHVRDVLTL
jgi:2,3-bisphosphoglycerate-dependent phosphoglycerate mutase